MPNLSLDELASLRLVLEYVPLKDILTSAMHYMSEEDNIKSKDNADLIFKALTFLK